MFDFADRSSMSSHAASMVQSKGRLPYEYRFRGLSAALRSLALHYRYLPIYER